MFFEMNQDLDTELCKAAAKGEAEKVATLIEQGADVDFVGDRSIPIISEQTSLWASVDGAGNVISKPYGEFWGAVSEIVPEFPRRDINERRADYMRIVRLLLEAGADVSKPCHGSTPLRIAVSRNDAELVQILLNHGADPNSACVSPFSKLSKKEGRRRVPGYFNTVLHEAVGNNNLEIVRILLNASADPKRGDHEGKTPLMIADEKGFTAIASLLRASMNEDPKRELC